MKKFLNIVLLILLVLFLGTGIVSFGGILPEYALPVYALAVGLLGVWGFKWLVSRQASWGWSPMHVPVLLFLAYAIWRYAVSPIEHASRIDLFHIGLYTMIYLLVAHNLYRPRDRVTIFCALILIALAESAYGVWQYRMLDDQVLWLDRSADYHGRGSGTYYCPNHLAGLLEMVLGLLAGWFVVFRKPAETLQGVTLRRMTELAAIGFIGLGLYSTASRGGWLALAIAILVMLVIAETTRTVSSRVVIGVFVALVLAGGVLLSLPSIRNRLGQSFAIDLGYRVGEQPISVREGFAGRVPMWQGTLDMIHDYAFLGTGPGTWQWFELKYRHPKMQIHPEYAHNDVLQLIAEYGIVGFTLIASVFVCFYWQALHLARRAESWEQRAFAVGAMAAVVAILVHSLVDFNLHIPANALVLTTLLGLIAAQGRVDRHWRTDVPRAAKQVFALVIFTIAIGGALLGYVRVYSTRTAAQAYDAAQQYEWEDAFRLYHRAINLDPKSPELHAQLGDVYRTQSEITTNEDLQAERQLFATQAIAEYQEAIQLNPYAEDVILNMAATYELAGDNESAFHWYQRVIQTDPNSGFNRLQLGLFYIRQGDTNQAVAAWELARQLMPGESAPADLLRQYQQPK